LVCWPGFRGRRTFRTVLAPLLAFVFAAAQASPAELAAQPRDPGPDSTPVGATRMDSRVVYRLRPSADAAVIATAALAISVPTLLASDIIHRRCPCDPSEINGFDRGAVGNHSTFADVTSDVTAVLVMAGPPLLDLVDVGSGEAFYSDAAVFAETLLVNGALVEIAKYTFQRPLPRTYAGDRSLIDSPGGYRSFYSGHTSTAFAALTASAMTLRLRYGERVWPWLVALFIGSSVAVERVAAGRHFPTDVLVGAVVGSGVGIVVPALHVASTRIAVVPARQGIAVAIRF
jgi:membrane-associated phospholipid phosphatase